MMIMAVVVVVVVVVVIVCNAYEKSTKYRVQKSYCMERNFSGEIYLQQGSCMQVCSKGMWSTKYIGT